MKTEVIEYNNFKSLIEKFGYSIPSGFAFIPLNFEIAPSRNDLVYSSEVKSVRKLLTQNKVGVDKIENENDRQFFLHQHNAAWLAPTIFIGVSLLSENPNAIAIALNVLSNYLTDFFKGGAQNSNFKMDIIVEVEKGRLFKKITIEGEPKDFKELAKLIKEITK
ncbi:MAG TPA: hypothetical protein PKL15_08525 [Saprospiraceae bacterium]|nr:hypothetical protein [Saprospiraceae bacterium]